MLTLTWLGQSGFLLRTSRAMIACDLYLSDYCRKNCKLDHTRKMPIPVSPEQLPPIDHYLISHGHIDHFDPETVGSILRTQLRTVFYGPPSCRLQADEFFPAQTARFRFIGSGRLYDISDGIRLLALPAAHEELEKDADGEYVAFSYLLLFDELKKALFFGGDTIPYPGQGVMLRDAVPLGYDLTLVLPVNGRDETRAKLGFKGNLTLEEAVALYRESGGKMLIPCHWGMFALNDLKSAPEAAFFADRQCACRIPELMRDIEL